MKYLEQYVKKVILIGIQPKNMSGEMTDVVRKNADELVKKIKTKKIKSLLTLD
jgi:hypothetical protein